MVLLPENFDKTSKDFDSLRERPPCVRKDVVSSEGNEVPRIVHLNSFFPSGPQALGGAPAGANSSYMDIHWVNIGARLDRKDAIPQGLQR